MGRAKNPPFRCCSTWVNYESREYSNIEVWKYRGRKSKIYIDGPSLQLALLPLDGADDEFIAVISRRPQGGGGANVISRATKQESAPNRRRNRFDEIKPAGWLLHAVAMTDSIAGNNRRE